MGQRSILYRQRNRFILNLINIYFFHLRSRGDDTLCVSGSKECHRLLYFNFYIFSQPLIIGKLKVKLLMEILPELMFDG